MMDSKTPSPTTTPIGKTTEVKLNPGIEMTKARQRHIEEYKQRLEICIRETLEFLGTNADLHELEFNGDVWMFSVRSRAVEDAFVHGMLNNYMEHEPGTMLARTKLEIALALGMGIHPSGRIINSLLVIMQENIHTEEDRNSPAEISARATLKIMVERKVHKGKVLDEFLKFIHFKQNVEEVYADAKKPRLQHKRKGVDLSGLNQAERDEAVVEMQNGGKIEFSGDERGETLESAMRINVENEV